MARLLLLVLTLVGFALVFTAKSPGLLGLGLLFGMAGSFGFVLAMAATRVSASARPDTAMASVDDLVALKKRPLRQAMLQTHAEAPADVRDNHSDRANV